MKTIAGEKCRHCGQDAVDSMSLGMIDDSRIFTDIRKYFLCSNPECQIALEQEYGQEAKKLGQTVVYLALPGQDR